MGIALLAEGVFAAFRNPSARRVRRLSFRRFARITLAQRGQGGVGARLRVLSVALAAWERRRVDAVADGRIASGARVRSIAGHRRSNTDGPQSNSRPSQSNSQSEMGPTERAVHEQLDQYRAEQPIRVELALNAARVLDDADRVNIHHQARRDMSEIVKDLTAKRKTKSGGRLATVSAMAGRQSG